MYLVWTAVIVILIGLLARRWNYERSLAFSRRQAMAARRLRLRLIAPGQLSGSRAGLAIRVRHIQSTLTQPDQQMTEIVVVIPSQVPVPLHMISRTIGRKAIDDNFEDTINMPSLDEHFIIRGEDEDKVNQLLANPNVNRLLLLISKNSATFDLNGRHVRIRHAGDICVITDTHLDHAVALAIALARAWHGPWREWAKARNWTVNDHGRRVAGRFHGTQIDVREIVNPAGKTFTRITADIVGGMPGGLCIQHIDLAPPDTQPFHKDAPDLYATANIPEAVHRLLRTPDLVNAVRWLVVHHIGSRVGERQAHLLMPGKVVELGPPVARLVDIVHALVAQESESESEPESPYWAGSS